MFLKEGPTLEVLKQCFLKALDMHENDLLNLERAHGEKKYALVFDFEIKLVLPSILSVATKNNVLSSAFLTNTSFLCSYCGCRCFETASALVTI